MKTLFRRHYLAAIAFFVQLSAILVSFLILYNCSTPNTAFTLSAAAYWSTIGVVGFAFLGIVMPLTVFVIAAMLIMIMCGANWKKVRFLSPLAFVLWGAYWVFLAHTICSPPPD